MSQTIETASDGASGVARAATSGGGKKVGAAGMFEAVLFKEWIKLRLFWALMVLASFGYAVFLSLRFRNVSQFYDAMSIWSAWIFKGYLFFGKYLYFSMVSGILLGALQFLPETMSRRVRLVLHLPLGEERVIGYHLLVGVLMLTGVLLPAVLVFVLSASLYFPPEFLRNLFYSLTPDLLAGYAGYLLAAAFLLETTWRNRVFHLLLAGASLRLFLMGDFYDMYLRVLGVFALWTVLLFTLPLLSSYRFRKGIDS